MNSYLIESDDFQSFQNEKEKIIKDMGFKDASINSYDLEEVPLENALEDLDTYGFLSDKKVVILTNIVVICFIIIDKINLGVKINIYIVIASNKLYKTMIKKGFIHAIESKTIKIQMDPDIFKIISDKLISNGNQNHSKIVEIILGIKLNDKINSIIWNIRNIMNGEEESFIFYIDGTKFIRLNLDITISKL